MHGIDRRKLSCALFTMAAGMARAGAGWPERTVRVVVPFPANGTTDLVTRAVTAELQRSTSVSFAIDNKPGAGGNLGATEVAHAAGDGHTLLVGTAGTHAINASLYERLPYDPVKDFVAIAMLAEVSNVLVMNPARARALGITDTAALVTWVKAHPGRLMVAHSGVGTSIHLCGEMFAAMVGSPVRHVAHNGSSFALKDVLAGSADAMFDNLPSSMPHIRQGRLTALAVTSEVRAWQLLDVPTLRESGVVELRNYAATAWFGLFAPAPTPRSVVDKIHQTLREALREPAVRRSIIELGGVPGTMGPEGLTRFAASETARWRRIVKVSGAKAE